LERAAKLAEEGFVCGKVLQGKRHKTPASGKIIRRRNLSAGETNGKILSKDAECIENIRTCIV
jgi:hypothetical protein